ncbi:hypothetical protein FWK35_00018804 [Aphis craccivora]|uniref:Uncharacterized protein n=1 Tax=Aphis craccivora TaxID=307492 RepID=A0A6G0YIL6_APHCR|nr:hypothetical protein FWK35_00018804 [Aphis craccivora]
MNKTSWIERKTNEQALKYILGKRSRGRPRTSHFKDPKNLMEVTTYSKLKKMANGRDLQLSQQGKAI